MKKRTHYRILPGIWLILVLIPAFPQLRAQEEESEIYSLISELTEQLEDENISPEYVFDLLSRLSDHPVNLNHPEVEVLVDIRLITPTQWQNLQNHIEQYGKLIAIYELQTIPDWDLNTINRLIPFARVPGKLEDLHLSMKEMLKQSDYTLAIFGERQWPESGGYSAKADTIPPAFEGDNWRHYVRLRAQYHYRLSAGVTLEKDAGESMFKNSNDHYDYASFHIYAQQLSGLVKRVAIGDYKLNMGQGLILNNAYGGSKSAYVTNVKKGGKYFRAHSSTSEIAYSRGIALELTPTKSITLGLFYSSNKRDGNILEPDTLTGNPDNDLARFTSFQTSGLHRTQSEIHDEKQIRYRMMGGKIGFESKKIDFNVNVLSSHFDKPLQRKIKPYNQFNFNGDELLNLSLDYSIDVGSLHLFGESAYSDNGAFAHLAGLKTGLSKNLSFVSLFRNYPVNYHAIEANAFGETRQANNETGLYLGLDWTISQQFYLSLYADTWKHNWLRFTADQISGGNEYLIKFRYYEKRKLEVYSQYKLEFKDQNNSDDFGYKVLEERRRDQLRIHMNLKLGKGLEWRSRAEFNRVTFLEEQSNGFLLHQDIIYRPLQHPFSFTCRYAFFKTDSYNSRIYAYENDLLYNFSLPAYFNSGQRFYLNLRYRPVKALTLEARYALTHYTDVDEIGSGHDKIEGNQKHETAFQIRFTF